MSRSRRVMWGCAAAVLVAVVLALAYATPAFLLFVLPCAVMLGAMAWTMWGGADGGPRHGGDG